MNERTCTIEGCEKPARSKSADWCKMHYHRWYRNGSPLTLLGPAQPPIDLVGQRFGLLVVKLRRDNGWVCACDCGAETFTRSGDLNRGSVLSCGDRREHWRLVDAGYSAAHGRVRRDRGHIASQVCVDCGTPARHWSYNHDDPDERLGTSGRWPVLIAYSLNPCHYSPRCVPCHKRFDLSKIHAHSLD